MKSIVVNLWGAPSAGKSKMAHGLVYKFKQKKRTVEFCGEVAKEWVWQGKPLNNPNLIFALQEDRINVLNGQVEFIVCDSPLPLPLIYKPDDYPLAFKDMVKFGWNKYINYNILIIPSGGYDSVGRVHSREEVTELQKDIVKLLEEWSPYYRISSSDNIMELDDIVETLETFSAVRN